MILAIMEDSKPFDNLRCCSETRVMVAGHTRPRKSRWTYQETDDTIRFPDFDYSRETDLVPSRSRFSWKLLSCFLTGFAVLDRQTLSFFSPRKTLSSENGTEPKPHFSFFRIHPRFNRGKSVYEFCKTRLTLPMLSWFHFYLKFYFLVLFFQRN